MSECHLKNENCGGRCTGYDGSKIWAERKRANDKIECESCHEEAAHLETFTHDIVNARLGKKIFDKKNWDNFVSVVQCANAKCKDDGRC